MRVLVAPHHFGNLLTPDIAAHALARGWRNVKPGDDVIVHPHSDGSMGFLGVLPGIEDVIAVGNGSDARPVSTVRTEVGGNPWHTVYCHTESFGGNDGQTLSSFTTSSSRPMGELLARVIDEGARRIVVGTGPTPWHDGGAGMLRELAAHAGVESGELREGDGHIRTDLAQLLPAVREHLASVHVLVASSREVPLRGLHGAGAELAELEHISPQDAQLIESYTSGFVNAVDTTAADLSPTSLLGGETTLLSRRSHGGTGGGVAFMLSALGARIYPGAWVTGEETGLNAALEGVDIVVTGAGIIAGDELGDGVVADVASRASAHAVPVVVVGGRIDASRRQMYKVGIHASYPVTDTPSGRPQLTAPPTTEEALVERGERLARTWSR